MNLPSEPCGICQGTGSVDTGGSTPWGAWITDKCPYCNGCGSVTVERDENGKVMSTRPDRRWSGETGN